MRERDSSGERRRTIRDYHTCTRPADARRSAETFQQVLDQSGPLRLSWHLECVGDLQPIGGGQVVMVGSTHLGDSG